MQIEGHELAAHITSVLPNVKATFIRDDEWGACLELESNGRCVLIKLGNDACLLGASGEPVTHHLN